MPRAPPVGSDGRGDATARRAGAVARATSAASNRPASRRAHASCLAGIVEGDVAHVRNLSCPQRNCTITGLGAYPESTPKSRASPALAPHGGVDTAARAASAVDAQGM
jgi:hypothetical protein